VCTFSQRNLLLILIEYRKLGSVLTLGITLKTCNNFNIQGYSQVILGLTTSRRNQINIFRKRVVPNRFFLFFNESKTPFIRTIFSCRHAASIKPKMYLCLNKNKQPKKITFI
jgi:hypothetical protein